MSYVAMSYVQRQQFGSHRSLVCFELLKKNARLIFNNVFANVDAAISIDAIRNFL
jgi:hypothetical protein